MKKMHFLIAVIGVLFLASAVALGAGLFKPQNAAAKDTPGQTVVPVGKPAVQQPAQAVPHDPAKCAERHASGQCQGHPPGGCDPAKCAEKHAGGQCQGHPPGQCRKAPSKK